MLGVWLHRPGSPPSWMRDRLTAKPRTFGTRAEAEAALRLSLGPLPAWLRDAYSFDIKPITEAEAAEPTAKAKPYVRRVQTRTRL